MYLISADQLSVCTMSDATKPFSRSEAVAAALAATPDADGTVQAVMHKLPGVFYFTSMCDRNFERVLRHNLEWMREHPRQAEEMNRARRGVVERLLERYDDDGRRRPWRIHKRQVNHFVLHPTIDDLARRSSRDLFRVVCGRRD